MSARALEVADCDGDARRPRRCCSLAGATTGSVERAGAFFGAGSALLLASLCAATWLLRRRARSGIDGHGWLSVSRLACERDLPSRPQRAVDRRHRIGDVHPDLGRRVSPWRSTSPTTGPRSGVGGYDLIVETLLPIVHDPNTREGREALNLFDLDQSVTFEPFRLLPGDDASCLNLYEPTESADRRGERALSRARPLRVSELPGGDRRRARESVAAARDARARRRDPGDRRRELDDLRAAQELGDDIVLPRGDREIRLRLVAALRDSIFQGELLMSEATS